MIRTVLNPETPLFREGRYPLLAIGEAKWNDTMGIAHLERLQHIRNLVTRAGRYDTSRTRLLCFSGAGFKTGSARRHGTVPPRMRYLRDGQPIPLSGSRQDA